MKPFQRASTPSHSVFVAALAAGTFALIGCGDSAPGSSEDTEPQDTVVPIDAADTGTPVDFDAIITYDSEQPDTGADGTGSDTSGPDTAQATCDDDPMPFYCPCDNNVQCASGYCVAVDESGVASRCSRTCEDSCPNGWNCRGVSTGGDPVFICLPPIDNLCEPCATDSTCGTLGDRCVSFSDGSYCGRDCQNDAGSCPDDYVCGEVTDENGQILAYQCVPESGSCNCPVGTDYDTDPDNCGGCGDACDYTGGIAGCAGGECFLDDCADGWVNLNEIDSDGCEYECTEVAGEDWPDAVCDGSSCDQDCDGIDGTWARGVFVDSAGDTNADGTPDDPIATIAGGIAKAQSTGRDHVYIAAGTYNEQVIVKEGVSLFGGYSNDGKWTRDLAQYQTVISSSSGFSSVRAMVIEGIHDTRTVVDGVTAVGGTNANPSGSSYGVWVRDCSNKLELVRVHAIGGNGGAGAPGNAGTPGANGNDGDPGTNASEWDYVCFGDGCDDYRGKGGAGGANACSSGRNSGGGTGGTPPNCNTGSSSGGTSPGGTPGGPGESPGQNGDPGDDGSNGAGGNAAGSVSGAGFWLGDDGEPGGDGENATGGGGGGSGKSKESAAGCRRDYGGGGGGGGGGGCGGTKGTGGKPGGGSFGLFLVDASPRLTDCQLGHKSGGNGGNGGLGGGGGDGKAGRAGGNGTGDATKGGRGGNGGSGGNGGHGGGGAGGVAFGLYIHGSSDPSCQGIGYAPPGAGGSGGLGGVGGNSSGNKGANGLSGDKNKSSSGCP